MFNKYYCYYRYSLNLNKFFVCNNMRLSIKHMDWCFELLIILVDKKIMAMYVLIKLDYCKIDY